MKALAGELDGLVDTSELSLDTSPLSYSCHTQLDTVEAVWRRLEREGRHAPYQRFDFLASWYRHVARTERIRPLILELTAGADGTIAILPLAVSGFGPFRIARWAGGSHANLNLGLWSPRRFGHDVQAIEAAVRAAARQERVDLIVLEQSLMTWQGVRNPLWHESATASLAQARKQELAADADAFFEQLFSKHARKNHRYKERALGDIGEIRHVIAESAEDQMAFLEAFLQQKAVWFKGRGLPDVFVQPGVAAFLGEAIANGCIELHALLINNEVVATFGVMAGDGRLSGMFNSFSDGPSMKYSPGDLLIRRTMRSACDRGLGSFDLGAGDAAYKLAYCHDEEPLFDRAIPVSAAGGMILRSLNSFRSFKSYVRKNPTLYKLVQRVRRAKSQTAERPVEAD